MKRMLVAIRRWRDQRFLKRLERVLDENQLHTNISGAGALDWDGPVKWQDSEFNAGLYRQIEKSYFDDAQCLRAQAD